ncbi:MAG: SDR family NAD(P)-dependent oxidoreductase [Candidatus Thorarchaeota archaeon]
MGKLDGKVALITGAAGGIGRATSKLFIQEGAKGVVMVDIWDEMGEKTAKELGPNALYIHADVSQENDIIKVIEITVEKFGRLDIVFSNAGNPGPGGVIEEIPTDEFDQTIAIHLRAAFLFMKHSILIMKKQGSGCFIFTSSVAGFQQGMGGLAYSISKAGLIHLARLAAVELGAYGIRANAIAPGFIATGIFGQGMGLSREGAEKLGKLMKDSISGDQAIRRSGLPVDIAQAALFLASNSSSFITGITLKVDGGLLSGRIPQDPEESTERWFNMISQLDSEDQKIIADMAEEGAQKTLERMKYLKPKIRDKEIKRMMKLAKIRNRVLNLEK